MKLKRIAYLIIILGFIFGCGKTVDLVMFVGDSSIAVDGQLPMAAPEERIDLKNLVEKKPYGLRLRGRYIFFKYNSTEIAPKSVKMGSSKDAIKKVMEFIKKLEKHPDVQYKLVIVGHSDSSGKETFNKKLSEKRAAKIYDILVNVYNIIDNKKRKNVTFEYLGRGEKYPLLKDINKNRRVEFLFVLKRDPRGKLILPK